MATSPSTPRGDGGYILAWLLRILALVALFAVPLFDLGSIVIGRAQVSDTASQAAAEANIVYFSSASLERARDRATEYAAENRMQFEQLTVDPRTKTLSVTLSKDVVSILAKRISGVKKYTHVQSSQSVPLRQ